MIESPKGMSIMEAYQLYRGNKLLVNRRYQRKLVWTETEKCKLIESILRKYPVPLILLATAEDGQYEIIDGMQRLNAFFGFIENQFSVSLSGGDKYFNTDDYTFAKTKIEEGLFVPKPKDVGFDFISQTEVSDFISYPLPVTIFKSASDEEINETFRRINSNGKHLSPQEVRQAGNTSQFANLVRELASEVRGDASSEVLLLSNMPKISIDNKGSQGYGINAEDTLWCKHGILRANDLRDSEDEQFIADIVLSVTLGEPFPASKDAFDNFYGVGEKDRSNEVELKINAIGMDNIKQEIKLVFSELSNFCDTYLGGKKLKQIVNPGAGSNPIKEDFYTIFMVFYELIIKEGKNPFDYARIALALNEVHSRLTRSRKYTTTGDRQANIAACKGLVQNYFKASTHTFRSSSSITIDFQNYLMRSKVESAVYDFKQGLYTLDPHKREMKEETFENKIIKNIAALANLGKNKIGYIFLGVTDKEPDTLAVERLDGLESVPRYYGFGIVGLEREAKLKGVSLDEYIAFITSKISQSQLPEDLKKRVTKSLTPITYHNMTVLMIEVKAGEEPVYYKDSMYERDGANCKEVKGAAQGAIHKLFK